MRILEIGVAKAVRDVVREREREEQGKPVGRLEAAFDVTRVEATATDDINFTRMVPPETILNFLSSVIREAHGLRLARLDS